MLNYTINKITTLPNTLEHSCCEYYNNKIYVFGGRIDKSNTISKSIYIYNIATNTWSNGCDLPYSISHATSCIINDDVYLIGGYTGSASVNTIYKYNITNNSITDSLASIPACIDSACCEYYNNKIYLMGGINDSTGTVSTNIFVYDIINDKWTSESWGNEFSLKTANSIIFNDCIYMFNGETNNNTTSKNIYIRNLTNNTTETKSNILNTERRNAGVTIINNCIYIFGGDIRTASGTINTIDVYNINDNISNIISNIKYEYCRLSVIAIPINNNIYLIGGRDNSNTIKDDIFEFSIKETTDDTITITGTDINLGNVLNPITYKYTIINNSDNDVTCSISLNGNVIESPIVISGTETTFILSDTLFNDLALNSENIITIIATDSVNSVTRIITFTKVEEDTPNNPPTIPSKVTYINNNGSATIKNNDNMHIEWEASTDLDGDAITYDIYFYDGSSWILVKADCESTSYDYIIITNNDISGAKFKVRAYDKKDYSDFIESSTFDVLYETNTECKVDINIDNTSYGEKSDIFDVNYTIGSNNSNNDNVYLKILIDGQMVDYIVNPFK